MAAVMTRAGGHCGPNGLAIPARRASPRFVNLLVAIWWLPETRPTGAAQPAGPALARLTESGVGERGPRQMLLTSGVITVAFALVYSVLPLVAARFFVAGAVSGPVPLGEGGSTSPLNQAVHVTALLTVASAVVTIASQLALAALLINRRGEMPTVRLFILVRAVSFALGAVTMRLGLLPFLVSVMIAGVAYGVLYPCMSTYISRRTRRNARAMHWVPWTRRLP